MAANETDGTIETVGMVTLRDGGTATVRRARAPLPAAVGAAFAWFLDGAFEVTEKPDLFVGVAAKGLLEDTARNDFAWAEVDGAIVATAWATSPADEPRLATVGEVYTDPAWRGHGLARAVCAALTSRFDADGGRVMFLGTGNGTAARIYAELGFVPYPRNLMRRETGGSGFTEAWFAPGPTSVREVTWGDVPRIVALYAEPNPWVSACWMQGLYSATVVTHDRCNSLVKHTWQATRAGTWLGLEAPSGALVGSAPLEAAGNEKDVIGGNVDLFVHPGFQASAGELLTAAVEAAAGRGWRWLRVELAAGDDAKGALLAAAGFRPAGRFAGAIRIAGAVRDVQVLRLDLG